MDKLPFDPNSLTQLHVVGSGEKNQRPIGKMLRSLAQKGVVSILLISQLGQLALAGPNAPTIPTQESFQHSMVETVKPGDEINQARLVNPIAQALERGQELPANTVRPGGISGIEIIRHWKDLGLNDKTIHELTEVLLLTQSPTFVTNDDAYTRASYLALKTSRLFNIKTQREADRFLRENSVVKLELYGHLPPGSTSSNVRQFKNDHIDNTVAMWDAVGIISSNDHPPMWEPMEGETEHTFNQAIENLGQAVGEAGFSSVKVPLSMWAGATKINLLADNIRQANNDLEMLTGWHGGVMGLNGRINYTVGIPYGVATASINEYGNVFMQANMNSFAHEWMHGLEAAVAYDMGYRPESAASAMFSMMEGTDTHFHEQYQTPHSISNVIRVVDSKFVNWNQRISENLTAQDGHGLKSSHDYFQKNNERLAYAFGSYVSAVMEHSPLVEARKTETSYGPQLEEAILAEQAWKAVFEDIGHEWWGPKMQAAYQANISAGVGQTQQSIPNTAELNSISHDGVDMLPRPRTRINVAGMAGAKIIEPRKPRKPSPAP